MTKAAVFGSEGRMGRLLRQEAVERGFDVSACYDISLAEPAGALPADVQVVFDFSSPSAFGSLGDILAGSRAALVSGTTGLGPAERALLAIWAVDRPVFHSPNMSLGIHVLGRLVFEAARLLGDRADVEIVEAHHRGKVDSPSGTALKLLESWSGGTGRQAVPVMGRSGHRGPRERDEVGMHSLRGGDVAGDHEVHIMLDGERILLGHRASGRRLFVLGALDAAAFVMKKPSGLYGMEDMMEGRGG